MPIHVVCEACGAEYNLREEFGGRKIQCKSCQTVFRVSQVAVVHGGIGLGDDLGHGDGSEGFPVAAVPPAFRPATASKALNPVPIRLCVSPEERKKRFGVAFINTLVWLLLILLALGTYGVIALAYGVTWLINSFPV
jgi:hypothetical protein